jgi:hypothetical protein
MSIIKTILAKKDSTLMYEQEQRLILLALIKTDFKIVEAHKLNAPKMNLESYRTKVNRYFRIRQLKLEYAQLQIN